MKSAVRFVILFFAVLFLAGAAFAWFDVLTHGNLLANPELKFASGWSVTGLMFLGFGLRGWRGRGQIESSDRMPPQHPSA